MSPPRARAARAVASASSRSGGRNQDRSGRRKQSRSGDRQQRAGRLHAVVLAGGHGTRFWPLSRENHPKPLIAVRGGATLLEETLDRARRFADEGCVWLVCGEGHGAAMRKAADLPKSRVLVEPAMRNTAMAIGWAARHIAARDPEAVLAVLPADHSIPDGRAFAAAIRKAARSARKAPALITLGIRPTQPRTGYGYIRLGKPAGTGHAGLHRVDRFVEKPSAARARSYLKRGGYLWNAGIFVWTAATLLAEIERWAPEVHRALPAARAGAEAVRRAYRRAPSVPIDKAVLERSRSVLCLPVRFHWSDVGTWASLAEELGVGPSVTRVIEGEALLCDATGNLVRGHGRPVVLLGVEGLAVIDAGDAVLVASLEHSDQVREVVDRLRKSGRRDLL